MVQRSYLTSHQDVLQRYIDALVEGFVRMRQDKPFAVEVLKKYYQSDDQRAMDEAYDYHIQKVYPMVPTLQAAQFGDAVELIAQKEPRVRNVELDKLIDNSLVQSAVDRGLSGAH